jgi:hypothetical protein
VVAFFHVLLQNSALARLKSGATHKLAENREWSDTTKKGAWTNAVLILTIVLYSSMAAVPGCKTDIIQTIYSVSLTLVISENLCRIEKIAITIWQRNQGIWTRIFTGNQVESRSTSESFHFGIST